MKKPFSIPPAYFLAALLTCIALRFLFPEYCIIPLPWNLLGLILVGLGLYLVIHPMKLFRRHNTPEKYQKSTVVVTTGPYGLSRNPMYLGGLLILLGFSTSLQNVISYSAAIVFFLVINGMFIPYEEDKMEIELGAEYLAYKARVRRWL
jgi:protein-S-isoprenylcysteine O-methyltransferase Ste14